MTYDLGFKKGVTEYWESHQDETLVSMDKKFGVHETTIGGWIKKQGQQHCWSTRIRQLFQWRGQGKCPSEKGTDGWNDVKLFPKANPWDNACIENWHALIKRQCLNDHDIQDHYHAKSLVFEYIEGFYNTFRIHSHCGYLSPSQYEQEYTNNRLAFANSSDEMMRAVSYWYRCLSYSKSWHSTSAGFLW